MIAGGLEVQKKAELFLPDLDLHCSLPDLPQGEVRFGHGQEGGDLCGGFSMAGSDLKLVHSCVREELFSTNSGLNLSFMWSNGGWRPGRERVLSRGDAAVWRTDDGWMMFGGHNTTGDLSLVVLIDDDFNKG